MANVDVSYADLTRNGQPANADVSYFTLQRQPLVVAANVDVSHISLTRGLESPITQGGIRVRAAGAWADYALKVRFDGAWQ